MAKRTILVVGGGIGGMACAIALARRGHDVELVEADPKWGVYGAGITITGSTYRALRRLGVVDEVLSLGFGCVGDTRICNEDGDVLAEVPAVSLTKGLPALGGIMRPALHGILSRKTRESGIRVTLGTSMQRWEEDGPEVVACFGDGRQERFEAIVIADGAFSLNRKRLFPAAPEPTYTGQYCWRITAERPPEIDRAHIYSNGTIFAGLIPTGDRSMYMWLLEPQPQRAHIAADVQVDRLREIMAPFGGTIGRLRNGLSEESEVNVRPLDALILDPPWHRGRLILIGDAAHSTTPHLASGAGIAIEDGVILGDYLSDDGKVEERFARFTAYRYERCRDVVSSSVAIGALQQARGPSDQLGQLIHSAELRLRADPWAELDIVNA